MKSDAVDLDALIKQAFEVRERAYAPYSKYRVGAALLDLQGNVFLGVNVENASYGLTVCAERSAISAAIAAGSRQFQCIAIASGGESAASPCGMCRQVLREFAPEFQVVCQSESGARILSTTLELLPHSFGPEVLAQGRTNERSEGRG